MDLGGTVEDVFVYHKVYGVLRAEMNIKSRMDIRNYMEEIRSGKSSLLKMLLPDIIIIRFGRNAWKFWI